MTAYELPDEVRHALDLAAAQALLADVMACPLCGASRIPCCYESLSTEGETR